MAVSIDTVYQRVLTLANKEQRGYITPQEFNLLANQAQMEIFEQYFYDVKHVNTLPGNTQEYSDPLTILYEKIGIFEQEFDTTWMVLNMPMLVGSNIMRIPDAIYRIGQVRIFQQPVELLNSKDYDDCKLSPLTAPTLTRPIGRITSQGLEISISATEMWDHSMGDITISVISRPQRAEWAYVIVNDKALYNDNISVDFPLHQSEETELVYRILKLAGINLKAQEIVQVGQTLEQGQISQEKK